MKLSFNYYENNIKKIHTYEVDKSYFLDNSDNSVENYRHIIETIDKDFYDKNLDDPIKAQTALRTYRDNRIDLNLRRYSWFNKKYQPGSLLLEYILNIINFIDDTTINDFILLIETLLEYAKYTNMTDNYFKIPIRMLKHRLDTNETKIYDMLYALTLCNHKFILPFFSILKYSNYSDKIRFTSQAIILLDRDLFFVKRSNVLKYTTLHCIAEHDGNREAFASDYDYRGIEDDEFSINRKGKTSKTLYKEPVRSGWYNRLINRTVIGLTLFYNECLRDSNIFYSFEKRMNARMYENRYNEYTKNRIELEVPVLLISECTGMSKEEIMNVINKLCRYTDYIKMHDKIYVNCGDLLEFFGTKKAMKKGIAEIKSNKFNMRELTKFFDSLGANYYDNCHNYNSDSTNIEKFIGDPSDIEEYLGIETEKPENIYIKNIKSYFEIIDRFETWDEKKAVSQHIFLPMSAKYVDMKDENTISPYSIFIYKDIFQTSNLGKDILKDKAKYLNIIKRFLNNIDNLSDKYDKFEKKDKKLYGDIFDMEKLWGKMKRADLYLQNTFNVKNRYIFADVPHIKESDYDTDCANDSIAGAKQELKAGNMNIENIFTDIKGRFTPIYHNINGGLNRLLQAYKFNIDAIARDNISTMSYHIKIHNKLKKEIVRRFKRNERVDIDNLQNDEVINLYESILNEEGLQYERENLLYSSSKIKEEQDESSYYKRKIIEDSYYQKQINLESKLNKDKKKKIKSCLDDYIDDEKYNIQENELFADMI